MGSSVRTSRPDIRIIEFGYPWLIDHRTLVKYAAFPRDRVPGKLSDLRTYSRHLHEKLGGTGGFRVEIIEPRLDDRDQSGCDIWGRSAAESAMADLGRIRVPVAQLDRAADF